MKNKYLVLIAITCIIVSCKEQNTGKEQIRITEKFNHDWSFHHGDDALASEATYDDSHWQVLDLPHDWSITEPYYEDNPGGFGTSYMIGDIGWYRKTFTIPADLNHKQIEVTFDGVYQKSTVWINGHKLGSRPFGYIGFKYDLTPHLLPGQQNVLAVRVDNSDQPNSRWYSGSGIYRNVWLTITDKIHIDPWEVFVTTPVVDQAQALIVVESSIENKNSFARDVTVLTEIFTPSGSRIAEVHSQVNAAENAATPFRQELTVTSPQLWSPETPNLYVLRHTITDGENRLDDYQTHFGIRHFVFDPQKGLILNGEPTKIKGVCMHHDLGALGAAVNVRAMERQLEILKEMGCNGIRTAHNPPAPELLQLCDRMGFIVMNETFDEWKLPKTKFGYASFWDEWHEQDLKDHIRRDRNHPSVFIWSIGNEILEQWHPQGTEMASRLAGIVRTLDSTRPITAGNNDPAPHNSIIKSGQLDLIGYNYKHETYARFPIDYPQKSFISTETTSALATRGSYDMPSDSVRQWPYRWDETFTGGNPDNSCSAYDNCHTPWGSTHEATWKVMKKHDFLSGFYIWTGFDYLGEPTPYQWPSRSSFFGIVDLAGFPKDIYHMYRSEWTHDTVLHIFPHWNWTEGQPVDVVAYYHHADTVELFLNGTSLGKKSKTADDVKVMWRVPFAPGTLKAVSSLQGKEVKTMEISTAGNPSQIKITPDRTTLVAGGEDLSFITIDVLDENGIPVPKADNEIVVSIEGDATLAGVDNGNPNSHHSFQQNSINAFNGKCLVIIRSGHQADDITINFTSAGLPGQEVKLRIKDQPGNPSTYFTKQP